MGNDTAPVTRRSNSADVARLAGVSRATVSYALNGRRNATVPEETRRRVAAAAEALGYKPSTLARSLKSGSTTLMGVYISIHEDSFHDRILHGIQEECDRQGYNVILARFQDRDQVASDGFQRMMGFNVGGVIHIVGTLSPEESASLREAEKPYGRPTVLVDDRAAVDQYDCIITDDIDGAGLAVQHLIDLGHTRIAHITGGFESSSAPDRLEGYKRTLTGAGIEIDESLVCEATYRNPNVSAAMSSLLALKDPPTAIFAANDKLASLAREFALERGLMTPKDLSIVGYGDLEIARYIGLTSIDQNAEQLGRLAVKRVFARMEEPHLAPKALFSKTRLVKRSSTGPCPRKDS